LTTRDAAGLALVDAPALEDRMSAHRHVLTSATGADVTFGDEHLAADAETAVIKG